MQQIRLVQLTLLRENDPEPLPAELREELVAAMAEMLAQAAREVSIDEQ